MSRISVGEWYSWPGTTRLHQVKEIGKDAVRAVCGKRTAPDVMTKPADHRRCKWCCGIPRRFDMVDTEEL